MQPVIVGLDIAKNVFHIHGMDRNGKQLFSRKLRRKQVLPYVAQLPVTVIAMESCSGSHYWGREFEKLGHTVRLVPGQYVKPYVKTDKSDAADAAAIAEAASRAHMRFVPVKNEVAQSLQARHRVLDRRKRNRTALACAIRGFLLEFGITIPVGIAKLRRGLREIMDQEVVPVAFQPTLLDLIEEFRALDGRVKSLERSLKAEISEHEVGRRLMTIPGIGAQNASALVAMVGDARAFKSARSFAAWLGLTPRESSSGGKVRLFGISKRGNTYLRTLLIHGARGYISWITRRADLPRSQLERWVIRLKGRCHANVATVALANKLARIIWAVMSREDSYRPIPAI